ncbi:hypothetical protein BDB13_4031 [Rhodococcus sp. OK302]|nr:hypothetical protein BDB13_4031 [Rhodococcus sp. OK302]
MQVLQGRLASQASSFLIGTSRSGELGRFVVFFRPFLLPHTRLLSMRMGWRRITLLGNADRRRTTPQNA